MVQHHNELRRKARTGQGCFRYQKKIMRIERAAGSAALAWLFDEAGFPDPCEGGNSGLRSFCTVTSELQTIRQLTMNLSSDGRLANRTSNISQRRTGRSHQLP